MVFTSKGMCAVTHEYTMLIKRTCCVCKDQIWLHITGEDPDFSRGDPSQNS